MPNVDSFVAFWTLTVVDVDYIYLFVASEAGIVGESGGIAYFDDGAAA